MTIDTNQKDAGVQAHLSGGHGQGVKPVSTEPWLSCLSSRKGMISGRKKGVTAYVLSLAGFRANSEIIGKFRKLKKFYCHFVKRQK